VRAGLEVVRQLGIRAVILDVAYHNEPRSRSTSSWDSNSSVPGRTTTDPVTTR
jgi:hypothetical protein